MDSFRPPTSGLVAFAAESSILVASGAVLFYARTALFTKKLN